MRLIDADAFIQRLREFSEGEDEVTRELAAATHDLVEIEATFYPIEAEPTKYGKWIECESENGIHFHKCSVCKQRDMYQGTITDWNGRGFSFCYKRQYCPVCGAKMDEVEE